MKNVVMARSKMITSQHVLGINSFMTKDTDKTPIQVISYFWNEQNIKLSEQVIFFNKAVTFI